MSQLALSLTARHPWVLDWLIARLDEARSAGMHRLRIRVLWEQLRWHIYVERREGEKYKLNNDLTAHYAREIKRVRPDLASMIEIAEAHAAFERIELEWIEAKQ